jgi:hypothetical protein
MADNNNNVAQLNQDNAQQQPQQRGIFQSIFQMITMYIIVSTILQMFGFSGNTQSKVVKSENGTVITTQQNITGNVYSLFPNNQQMVKINY